MTNDRVCDFCNGRPVTHRFPCRPVQMVTMVRDDNGDLEPKTMLDSDGEWAACAECHALLEKDDLEDWFLRCEKGHADPDGLDVDRLAQILSLFLEHRDGDPVPICQSASALN